MSTHNICFFLRNKKDISIFRMKKAPYLLLCYLYFFQKGQDSILSHSRILDNINADEFLK